MSIPLKLLPFHDRHGALTGEVDGVDRVLSYGDARLEHAALGTSVGLVDRSSRGKLKLTGADRLGFLHGMVTNDVKRLTDGAGTYAAMITVKGKMVGDVRILRREDALLVDLEPGLAPSASEFLNRYLISEDVEIADVTDDLALLSFVGPRAAEAVSLAVGKTLPSLDEHQQEALQTDGASLIIVGTRLTSSAGLDVLLPMDRAEAFAERALERGKGVGLVPCGFEALEIARIEAGIPRFGLDMGEDTIPLEAGLEARAISYDKGCYVGQEVIARAHYRGHMNRQLAGLTFADGAPPPRGTPLFKEPGDPKALGTVTSAVVSPRFPGVLCLGYVRREHLAPGTVLKTAEGRVATVASLPFRQ